MRRNKLLKVSLTFLLLFCLTALGYAAWTRIRAEELRIECQGQLRDNYEAVNEGKQVVSIQEYQQRVPPSLRQCPASQLDYEYHPFSGPRHIGGIFHGEKTLMSTRMLLWCPTACHGGQRHVILEDGSRVDLSEAQFQAAAKASYTLMR